MVRARIVSVSGPAFAELAAATNFSFLRAGSHPEEMVLQAKALGLAGLGVADRCTLAGAVRAHVAAKAHGLGLIVGARLVFTDATPDLIVYPVDRKAYSRLVRLLTIGNRRAPKGQCHLTFPDYLAHAEGLQTILVPALAPGHAPAFDAVLAGVREASGQAWLAAPFCFDGEDRRRLRLLREAARRAGARLLATTEPLIHHPDRRELLDVLTCIREKTTLDAAGLLLAANAERHLKPPAEMARLYREAPEAVENTKAFFESVDFSLDQLRYVYPDEAEPGYETPQAALAALTWEGARRRFPQGPPDKVIKNIERELAIIAKLDYAPYFLTVHDIVRWARAETDEFGAPKVPILCQGRGSAANSTLCYCLGVTEVDPSRHELLFDRFVSEERDEPPDIDIDFEHERREEVIQYVYRKYGRERAGLAATLICYRGRSAIREVGKAFGFSQDRIASLSKLLQWWAQKIKPEDVALQGFDLEDPRLAACLRLAQEMHGFPRHLSQHVGGFVITRERLDDLIPIQNAAMADRTVVEWDKDDLEALGILKVDLLGLGMLSCLKRAFDLIAKHYGDVVGDGRPLDLARLPKEDPRVYAMLKRADSIGVFQVESRAQMSMLPRLRPEQFYDLVIEVAIVRPGPIQGGMVHPYLRRKQGLEKVVYPSTELEAVLKRTLGVPLFQEQAMQIAIVAAGFTPPEADKLRRAMATFRRVGTIGQLREKFVAGMIARGYQPAFAAQCFAQIEGFGEYGFPESHAASFALLVYASSWVKCFYPDVFAAALLNSQPMGFYAPAQIVRDAGEHGVEARPVDVNASFWDSSLEPAAPGAGALHPRHAEMAGVIGATHALRLGLRQVQGLREDEMARLVARRGAGYDSVRDLWLRGGVSAATIERLAGADAFASLGLDRRSALWAARALNRVGGQEDAPLLAHAGAVSREPDFALPPMLIGEQVVEDYRTWGLSLRAHPGALLRPELTRHGAAEAGRLPNIASGARVRVAGLVLVRQRPGTAAGVIFMTLEDETGVANVIVWPKVYEQFRPEVLGARLCAVDGRVQSESGVIHVIAEQIHDFSPLLAVLSDQGSLREVAAPGDEVRRPGHDARHPRNVRHDLRAQSVMPKGRNFH